MNKTKYTFNQFKKDCPTVIDNYYVEKSKVTRKEDSELIDVVAWFKYKWPQHSNSIMHPANEGTATHGGHRRELKQKGMLSGAHDLILLVPAGMYGFGTFELKRGDHKSSVAGEQVDVALTNLRNGGYSCFCWGVEETKAAITKYMSKRGE